MYDDVGAVLLDDVDDVVMTPLTCRAARVLLEITQQQLADQAEVGIQTLIKYENGGTVTHPIWLRIKRALEVAGIQFIDENGGGEGVRRRKAR